MRLKLGCATQQIFQIDRLRAVFYCLSENSMGFILGVSMANSMSVRDQLIAKLRSENISKKQSAGLDMSVSLFGGVASQQDDSPNKPILKMSNLARPSTFNTNVSLAGLAQAPSIPHASPTWPAFRALVG